VIMGANERIRMGVIGCGGMARHHLDLLTKQHAGDVDVVAICDVYEPNAAAGREFYPGAELYGDYRRVLDRRDVDAVLIATPDHWHCRNLIDAVRAGKDAYCEKPMSWSLEQSAEMVREVRKTDRIVQIGMQRRSAEPVLEAKKLVDAGLLGDVSLARVWWYWNFGWLPPESQLSLEGKLDWDRFQEPCAEKDRVPLSIRRFRAWRYFWAYSGGNMTDQGTHLLDVVQWFCNAGEPPLAAQAFGENYAPRDYETPDTLCAIFEFPKFMATFTLTYNNNYLDAWGICLQGNKGTLLLDDTGAKLFAEPWKRKNGKPPPPAHTVEGGLTVAAHWANFIECVRTRKQPNAPVEVGQKAVAGLHLANIAHHRRRRAELARDGVTVRVT